MPYDDCELTEGVTYEVLPENEFTKQIPSFSQGFVRLQPYNQVTDHMYCAVQKNSVPAAAGAVATSHTVFLLNRVLRSVHLWVRKWVKTALFMLRLPRVFAPVIWAGAQPHQYVTPCPKFYTTQYKRFIYADWRLTEKTCFKIPGLPEGFPTLPKKAERIWMSWWRCLGGQLSKVWWAIISMSLQGDYTGFDHNGVQFQELLGPWRWSTPSSITSTMQSPRQRYKKRGSHS